MTHPLAMEVITYAPTAYYHCNHCELIWQQAGVGKALHNEQINAFPDDVKEDYAALCDWIRHLFASFGNGVTVKVVDAASAEGFWKSLRYGIRRYPAFIVGGQEKHIGFDPENLEKRIALLIERDEQNALHES